MDKKIHLITGLPRSGSTMLSAILKQNPRFHASITDSLATLVKGVIETSQAGPGMKYEVPEKKRESLVKGLFRNFYEDIDNPVVFNTNRAWTYLTPLMHYLFPETKMLVCVRDINWVLDSFELAHRRNPLSTNTVMGGFSGSVYDRTESLMKRDGIVGFPYMGIKQAITGNEKHMLMLVEYDLMCKNPEGMMKSIYNFIKEPYFEHDFNNVEGGWDEYDSEIGVKLHTVSRKVKFTPRQTILPPDVLKNYENMEVWRQ